MISMSKIDFSKVENALREGLLKMSIQQLIVLADLANIPFGLAEKEVSNNQDVSTQTAQALAHALKNLETDLKKLKKKDASMYEKLGINKQELKQFFEHPQDLTPQDWEKIRKIRDQIEIYKQELRKNLKVSDQDIVQSERKKQNYKRFNVNEKWIPLK